MLRYSREYRMESISWLERAALLGAAIVFLAAGVVMLFYALAHLQSRAKAKRPYMAAYFAFFVLGAICTLLAIFK